MTRVNTVLAVLTYTFGLERLKTGALYNLEAIIIFL